MSLPQVWHPQGTQGKSALSWHRLPGQGWREALHSHFALEWVFSIFITGQNHLGYFFKKHTDACSTYILNPLLFGGAGALVWFKSPLTGLTWSWSWQLGPAEGFLTGPNTLLCLFQPSLLRYIIRSLPISFCSKPDCFPLWQFPSPEDWSGASHFPFFMLWVIRPVS